MSNKFVWFLIQLNKYFKICFSFWLSLLKGLVIYSLVPSTAALLLTLDFIHFEKDADESEIKKVFTNNFNKYRLHRGSSFVIVFSVFVLVSLIYLSWRSSLFVVIGLLIYAMLLLLTTFTYAVYFLAKKQREVKEAFIFGFVTLIKNIWKTVVLIVFLVIFSLIAYYNLVIFVCPAGHLATRKGIKHRNSTTQNPQLKYFFDVNTCKGCPLREGCYKEGAKTKSYSVTIKSTEHVDQEAFQETAEFKELAALRYKIEAKNAELKNRHGYEKAITSGLFGMKMQGAATIFVVNMKRIIKLINEKEVK